MVEAGLLPAADALPAGGPSPAAGSLSAGSLSAGSLSAGSLSAGLLSAAGSPSSMGARSGRGSSTPDGSPAARGAATTGGAARQTIGQLLAALSTASLLVALLAGTGAITHTGDVRVAGELRSALASVALELATLERLIDDTEAAEQAQRSATDAAERERAAAGIAAIRKAVDVSWSRVGTLELPADLRIALSAIQEDYTAYVRRISDQLPVLESYRSPGGPGGAGASAREGGEAAALRAAIQPVRELIAVRSRTAAEAHDAALGRIAALYVGAGAAMLVGIVALFAARPFVAARPQVATRRPAERRPPASRKPQVAGGPLAGPARAVAGLVDGVRSRRSRT